MDISVVIGVVMGALALVNAWLLFSAMSYRRRQEAQEDRLRALEIDLPRSYVSKASLSEQLGRIEGDLKEVKSLILQQIVGDKQE